MRNHPINFLICCLGWGRRIFVKGLGFCVGQGDSVRFWFDDWVGVGPFLWEGNVESWNISVRRVVRQLELVGVSHCPVFFLIFSYAGMQ